MRKLYPLLLAFVLIAFRFPLNAQGLSYYQAQFKGGVTACGYSPDYTAGGTGTFTVNIAPGSTIQQAYLMAGRQGPAAPVTVTFNGSSLTFDNTNQVSPTFQSIYGGNSAVHSIDVTAIVNPAVNSYTLVVPSQASTSDRFEDFYLYIAYANNALGLVSTAIFVNTVDCQATISYPLTLTYPMGNTTNVGLSLFLGYACNDAGDGEEATVNGTLLGQCGGPNSNSNICGGPYGDFYYQNATLFGLLDGNPDQAINGPDALSNIQALVTNCSTNLTVEMDHAPGGSPADNAVWGLIFAYTAVSQPVNLDTTVCTGTPVQLNLSTGGGTVSWAPTTGLSCNNCGNPLATPAVTTTYIATITGGGCGNVSDTITINLVNTSPTVTIQNNDTTICGGSAVQLNATSTDSITWSPGTGLSCTACSSPLTTPAVTTTYIATVGRRLYGFRYCDNYGCRFRN